MPSISVVSGRNLIDTYRTKHSALHKLAWDKDVPDKHTPLLDEMLIGLKTQNFKSLEEFFDKSDEENVKELGFSSMEDFEARATDKDRKKLEEKWR